MQGLSLEEVGERIGKSAPTISRWERGIGRVPVDEMFQLAEMYGVSHVFLMGWDEEAA